MARIIITIPDDEARTDWAANYLREVADQLDQTYLSGHVKVDKHWTSEGVR